MKFKTRKIGDLKNPIFLVGECPGNQRKSDLNHEVFHGNRTGDLIEEVIDNKFNIYLTNITNYKNNLSLESIRVGLNELKSDIINLKPSIIVCLGKISSQNVSKLISDMNLSIKVVSLYHPSYILRFNQNVNKYKEELTSIIECH